MKTQPPAIFSFFAGAGFLDLGFEKAGYDIAYVNEVHKPFLDAHKFSRENMGIAPPRYGYFEGDITDCLEGPEAARITELMNQLMARGQEVGFIGGPPCPDFSIAGKNHGKEGENGKLSQTYVDLICRYTPDFFVFENVKGLYRTLKHRTFFEALKAQLTKSGYLLTERLINAIEYGAPQDRERIILFGIHTRSNRADVREFDWIKHAKYPNRTAFQYPWPGIQPSKLNRSAPKGVPIELTVEYWFRKNDVMNHPNADHCFTPRAGLSKFLSVEEGDDSRKSYKRLHRWRYSPTAAYGNNEVHIHPFLPRRLSVAEALAIQSLPREFTLSPRMTLTDMFKTIGNGVPFLAAHALALTIREFLSEG